MRTPIVLDNRPIIGLTGYYQERFIRERTDGIELEHSKPLESWWKSAVATAGIVLFVVP